MNWEQVKREIHFRADRSSGSGGQHVNKVATKVTLLFYPESSLAFTEEEKALLLSRLLPQLTNEGALIVTEQRHRSQALNRKYAWEKIEKIIRQALRPPAPPRKKPQLRIDRAALKKSKQRHSEKKSLRRKIRPHQL
jgi:ribosome-associated protein